MARQQRVSNDRSEKIKQQAKTSAPTYDRKAKQVYVRSPEVDKANAALKSGVSYLYNFGDNNVQKPDDNLYAQALAAFNPGGTFVPAQAQAEIAAKKAANRSRYMDALDTSTRAGVAAAGSGTTRSVMDTSETQAIKNEIAGKMAAREKDRTNAGKHFRSVRGNDDYRDRVLGFDNGALPYGRTDTARLRYALDEDYRGQLDTFNQRQGLLENPYDNLKYLTDEERRDLRYYASRGEYDRANEYLDFLAPDLNARMQGIASNEMAKLSEEQPVAGVLANIAASREAGMGVLPTIRGAVKEQMGIYEPVDTNSRGFRAAHMLRDTTEGVGNAAYNAAGGGIAGDTARFLAEAGLSAAQNASLLPMGGTAPLVFMGAQAAGSTALDTLESGGTATQALELAAASAVIESATEKIGIDNFFRISRLGKKGIQQLLKDYKLGKPLVNDLRHYASQMGTQMAAEGAEEMIAEVAGNIADMAIRGDNGEYAQLVQAYVAQGMSEEKAKARAFTDMYINNVLKAGAQGAVAGGMLGAGGAAIGTRYNNELTAVGAQLAELGLQPADVVRAAQQSGDKEAQEFARELSQKLVLGEEVSLADMGKLHLLSNRYATSEQFVRAEAAAQAEQANTQSAGNAPATAPSNAEGEEQRSQNQPVEAQNVTKVASAEDVAPKATNNTESIEPATGQAPEETAQSNAPTNATEEERAEVREATKTNMSAAMPTQTTEAQEEQTESSAQGEQPAEAEEAAKSAPGITVSDWIMKKKFSESERAAIENSGAEPTIVKESEKAYRLRWSTESGNIEDWFPKKTVFVETAEEKAAAEEAGRSLNVGDRVMTRADGEGEIVGSGQSENYVKVKLDNGKEKTYLRRTLTKIEGGEKNGETENVEGPHDEAGVSDNGGVREADAGLLAEVAPENVRGDSEKGEPSGALRPEGNGDAGLAVRDDAGRSGTGRSVGDSEGGNVPASGEVETAEEETTQEEEEKPAFKRGDRVKTKAGEAGVVRSVKGDRVTIKTDEGKAKTFKATTLAPTEETAPSAEERPDSVTAENSTTATEENAAKPAVEATDKGTEIFNRLVSSLNKGDSQYLVKGRASDGTYFAGTSYAMAAVPKETYDSVEGRDLPSERLMQVLSGAGERLTDVYRYTKEGGKTSPMYILRGASDKRVAVRQSFLRPFAGYDFYSSEMEGVKHPTVKAVDGNGATVGFVLPFTNLDVEHIALEKLTKADLSKAPATKNSPKKEKAPANSTEENNDANAEQRAEKEAEQRVEEEIKQKAETALQDPPRGSNFIIPAEGLNLPQGEKARYKANVDAIRLLRKLQAEDRFATPEEQTVLSKYVGWGGLSNAFNQFNDKWAKEYAELKELLTEEEFDAARRSTTNAHYTEVGVIRGIYEGLAKLGFEGGRVLEPSAGVGHFVGAMPAQTRPTRWTMVELDNITGNIAKYLYPNADVRVQGFEKTKILDNYMDAAISNVPFGNYPIVDKGYPRAVTASIHNYFFAKALDKVRPGGLVVFITSRFTMDNSNSDVRKYIMGKADLLGAIRLPDTAFKSNAATPVVTDIIVLKKRAPNTEYNGEAFENANRYHTHLQIQDYSNEYFQSHPEMVLGEASSEGSMYRSNSLTYKAKNTRVSLGEQIAKAMENITGRMEYPAVASPEEVQKEVRKAQAKGKNGSLSVQNGEIVKNNNGVVEKVSTSSEKDKQRLISIINIRDAARNLLNLQNEGAPDSEIKTARAELNTLYDGFVKKYGFLNSTYNAKFLKQDVDAPFIRALEVWNSKEKSATKADIFTKNTVTPNVTVTSCDTINDALAVSLNETGEVRPARIAELLGRTEADVTKELLDTEAAYKDREGKLIPAFLYLSGSVRAKLREAETLLEGDKSYQRNVDALKKVIPKNIPYTDIQVQPGATWVPTELYSQFANELLGGGWFYKAVNVKHIPSAGAYVFESKGDKRLKASAASTSEWGTPEKPFIELYEALLNNKEVRVYVPGTESKVLDVEATAAAKEKMKKISDRFQSWLWEDAKRREELSQLYNNVFNDYVPPTFDGSTLTVNGSNAEMDMREHQRNAVYRAIMSGGNILLAHKVGAGKTYEMAAIAMKLRQLGTVKKPLFVVPKSLVAQWGKEFLECFPAAKVLVADGDSFNTANRKTFINRMATGDYDAIICSQEQLKKIPLSVERQTAFYRDQITAIETALQEQALAGERNPKSVKEMEKLKARLEAKMKELAEAQKDEDNIDFEDIGIDGIFVDEAHYYKNLMFQSSMQRVAGLGNRDGAQRAFDLFMKVKYLQEFNGGRGVCFATATPIMNSVAEMYTMQKYLNEDALISKGITSFDAWVKQFGEVTTEIEQTEKGKFREINVLSRFKNVPELQTMFRSFADVVTKIPGLKIPTMKGGKRITVAVEPSDFQKAYMQKLAERAEAVRSGRVDPSEDNMLRITGEGRKVSYTQKMFDTSLPYEPEGKIMAAVKNIYTEWENSKDIKGTQLVFLDMGVPKAKDKDDAEPAEDNATEAVPDKAELSIYADMKNFLVGMGIPANEIAFIHDAKNDAQRKQLFADVNDGKVRVLLGSTGKMGVGMNAQKRVVAMHHMDAPWRPGDLEQREGRGLRQKNMNDEVSVYVYVTKETIEETMWSRIHRKATFINQIMSGDISSREIKDEGDLAVSAAEIKAIASGNPLLVEQFKTSQDLAKLETLKSAHAQEVASAEVKIEKLKTAIETDAQYIETLKEDIRARKDVAGDKFNITVGGKSFTERKEAGDALIKAVKKHLKIGEKETSHEIGSFAGFKLLCSSKGDIMIKGKGQYRIEANMQSASGTVQRLENLVKNLDDTLKKIEQRKSASEKDLTVLENFIKTPFAKEAELAELRKRADDIDRQLAADAQEQTAETAEETEPEESAMYSATEAARWNAAQANKANETERDIKPISTIIEEIQDNFGIQLTQGHIRGNKVLGRFNKRNKGIRIKKSGDLVTAAHELGHALDDRYGLREAVKADSKAKEEAYRAFDLMPQEAKDKYGKKARLPEGIAEYIRQFLSDRQTAEAEYPALTKIVLNAMSTKELAQFEQLADDINNVLLNSDTATSSIRFAGEETLKERVQSRLNRDAIRAWWNNAYQKWVDSNHSIKRFDRETGANVYRFATNAAYSDARAKSIIENGLYDMDANYIGESLASTLSGVNLANKRTYREFGEYLVVKHGPERLREGMDVFSDPRKNTEEFMQKREAEIAEAHPEFVEAAKKLYKFQTDFLMAWGVESGLVSAEKAQEWGERWEFYVPFQRYMGDEFDTSRGAKRGFANQSSPYKKARGSGRDIIHPVDSIISNIIKTVNGGVRNDVFARLTRAAKRLGANATILEKIPVPLKRTVTDISEYKQAAVEDIWEMAASGLVEENAAKMGEAAINTLDDLIIQYGRGKAFGNVVTVMIDGKPEFWKINDPSLLDALCNLSPAQVDGILDAYGMISRFITSNLTGMNVIWSIFSNMPRDITTAITLSRNHNPVKLIRGMASAYVNKAMGDKADPIYKEYLAIGGGHGGVYSADHDVARKERLNMTKGQKTKEARRRRARQRSNPLYWLENVSNAIESGPRFATYKYLREQGADSHEAFYEAMEVTTNFRRGGQYGKQLNKAVPFFNAGVQGLDRFGRWLTAEDAPEDMRAKTAVRRTLMWVAVSAAVAGISYALNHADPDRDKDYEKLLSTYTKNNFFIIPLGNHKFFAIPKPREIAVLSSLFERVLGATIGGNKQAFYDFYDYFADQCLPPLAGELAKIPVRGAKGFLNVTGEFGLFGVFAYIGANTDFLGRPIESQALEQYEKKDRYNERTSVMAKKLGAAFKGSPVMIDYFLQNTLGGFWKTAKALFPVDGENRDLTGGIVASYVKDPLYSTDIVNRIYDKAEASSQHAKSNPNDMDAQIAAKMDANMQTYYSHFFGLEKDAKKAGGDVSNARRSIIIEMSDYMDATADGKYSATMPTSVYNAVKSSKDASLLPAVMPTKIKDGEGAEHELSPEQYVRFQGKYLSEYYSLARSELSSAKDKAETLKDIGATAKENATKATLTRMNLPTEKRAYTALNDSLSNTGAYKKANAKEREKAEERMHSIANETKSGKKMQAKAREIGVTDNQYMELLVAADVADRTLQKRRDGSKNESQGNGSVTQDEYIAALEMTRLSREQKRKAFAAKWPKSKNNPYN